MASTMRSRRRPVRSARARRMNSAMSGVSFSGLPGGVEDGAEVEGLVEELDRAAAQGRGEEFAFLVAGYDHGRGGGGVPVDPLQQFDAAHARHLHVGEHDYEGMGLARTDEFHGRGAVVGGRGSQIGRLEHKDEHLARERVAVSSSTTRISAAFTSVAVVMAGRSGWRCAGSRRLRRPRWRGLRRRGRRRRRRLSRARRRRRGGGRRRGWRRRP